MISRSEKMSWLTTISLDKKLQCSSQLSPLGIPSKPSKARNIWWNLLPPSSLLSWFCLLGSIDDGNIGFDSWFFQGHMKIYENIWYRYEIQQLLLSKNSSWIANPELSAFGLPVSQGDGAIGSYVGVLRVDGCRKAAMKYLGHPCWSQI